jgi:hypothetical protein
VSFALVLDFPSFEHMPAASHGPRRDPRSAWPIIRAISCRVARVEGCGAPVAGSQHVAGAPLEAFS